MQSIRSSTRLLHRNRFSIANTLPRFTSSSSATLPANESRSVRGFDSSRSTRAFDSSAKYLISSLTKAVSFSSALPVSKPLLSLAFDSSAKYLISSLTKAVSFSSALPFRHSLAFNGDWQNVWQKHNLTYSSRCFSTVGDSVQSVPQGFPVSAPDAPPRIKFKRLDKTAKHIMQIVDKEAVEEVRTRREIPEIRPGYIVQLKVEVPENKRRVSIVKGIVIARRNAGLNSTFRIRRLVAGVGVESMFPLYSPNLREIKVLDKKRVRRAKLYYLRDKMNALKKH
ncbi:hypothetical protein F2Q69_00000463 [Brassica cretica]|uniref:Uncharacterized protein n=1 Tax=Brassica cretica TaxID=69181 RepID=A0A8S9PK34_BRACR|nr:hypothetical protein F2Q69_00000463 [Brassica cretica]